MPATRRTSGRLAVRSGGTPMASAQKSTTSGKTKETPSKRDTVVVATPLDAGSDAPMSKRRRLGGRARFSAVEVPDSSPARIHPAYVAASAVSSASTSGAASPLSYGLGTETPATSIDDIDGMDIDDDEKYERRYTTAEKGKGKAVIEATDSEDTSPPELEPPTSRSKRRAPLGRPTPRPVRMTVIEDSEGEDESIFSEDLEAEESEFEVDDGCSEGDYSSEDEQEESVNPRVLVQTGRRRPGLGARSRPPISLPIPAPEELDPDAEIDGQDDGQSNGQGDGQGDGQNGGQGSGSGTVPISASARRRLWRANSRRDNDRAQLFHHHPELAVVWQTYDAKPKIPVKEASQPDGLSLKLLPFQREGLYWLQEQEKTEFCGGILADEMGMGKTIQTLALIMATPDAKPNLVVAPTVAVMQWRSEIEKYTGSRLSVYIYHGASRTSDHKVLARHNVVLTTYSVLESVFRKQNTGFRRKDGIYKEASALHKVKYHRVILDEAHNIKDRACNTAKAVYALNTKFKLCLSGTPLQNRIGELFSLLRFLEVDPFAYYYCKQCPCKQLHWKFSNMRNCDHCKHSPMSHMCFFNNELLKPIQRDGYEDEGLRAYQNIQKLLKQLMLRRTKNEREEDLGLPPKVVRIRRDMFTDEELDLYDSIYSDGKRKFDTYVANGVVLNNYANIFTLITRMRQMADHPDLVLRKHSEDGQNVLVCVICDDEAEDAIKSKCHHSFCRDCVTRYLAAYDGNGSPECPKCHVTLSIDISQPAVELDQLTMKKNSIVSRIDMSKWRSSTKIEALCEELYKLRSPYQTTKSIVFSQFTSMLQLIEWRLHRGGFKTVMLEGSMSPSQREATINHFMNNVDVEVFLVSLKAGGVALNLIEANQVFIMDPWWNPATEWQAADRVHRIGQKRLCTITRLIIQDSIESRIVELQEKKANLISATVNSDQGAMDKLTPADMQFLFKN